MVQKLTRDLQNYGRTVFCDNFFGHVALAADLYRNNTFIVSTVGPKRIGNPTGLVQKKTNVKKHLFIKTF
jgi:hypothetical protein